jgi:uncharacterized membrane protein
MSTSRLPLLQQVKLGVSQPWVAVLIVAVGYAWILAERVAEVPDAFTGFGFHPQVLLGASWSTQVHLLAGAAAIVLGLLQLRLAKGTLRHRVVGYAWALVMLALCGSALLLKQHMGLLQILAIIVIGLVGKAIWHARRHEVEKHAHLMRVLVLGATLAVGLFTALPGRVSWQLFFSGPSTVAAAR